MLKNLVKVPNGSLWIGDPHILLSTLVHWLGRKGEQNLLSSRAHLAEFLSGVWANNVCVIVSRLPFEQKSMEAGNHLLETSLLRRN